MHICSGHQVWKVFNLIYNRRRYCGFAGTHPSWPPHRGSGQSKVSCTLINVCVHTLCNWSIHTVVHVLLQTHTRNAVRKRCKELANTEKALTETQTHTLTAGPLTYTCVQTHTHTHTNTHTPTLTAGPDRRRTDWRYTGPTISTLLFAPGPMDLGLDTLYVIQMCRGGYGVRSMKMWSDICSSQKMSQGVLCHIPGSCFLKSLG